jgi:sugar transferase EpsL
MAEKKLHVYKFKIKRLLDISISAIGLIVLSPVFLAISVLLKFRIKGPIIFKQARPGEKGKLFNLCKFRTMACTKNKNGILLPDKMRLTKAGKFLRRFSLDELPELWNVLRGDMSLVGPRPLLVEYLDRYTPEQARRHEVKPGITGWAQVNGRNAILWEEKFKYDIWYVDNWNLWLDIKIIFMTINKVLAGEGINQPGKATMDEFKGTTNNWLEEED